MIRPTEKTQNLPFEGNSNARGFTLIEVAIAVVILSAALVTLLGLQSAALEGSLRTKQKQVALAVGRRILSQIERGDSPLDPEERTTSAEKLLESLGGGTLQSDQERRVQAHLSVSAWGVPGAEKDAMKKVLLHLSWSDNSLDSVDLVYFLPSTAEDPNG